MSDRWIQFAQAVALLVKKYGGADLAAQALYEKLATGAIRSIAGEITRFKNCDAMGGAGRPSAHREHWRIPPRLWGHVSLSPLFGGEWQQSAFRAVRCDFDWGSIGVAGERIGNPWVVTTSYHMRFVAVNATQIEDLIGIGAERNAISYANSRQKAADWLKAEFENPATVGIAKPEFMKRARAAISGLSGRGFEAAWKSAVVEFPDRAKAGRRARHPLRQ